MPTHLPSSTHHFASIHDSAVSHGATEPVAGRLVSSRTRPRHRGVIGAVLLFLGCAAACSLPLLMAAGAAAGLGAFLSGARGIGLAVLVLLAGATTTLLWRRRAGATTSCGCGSC